VANPLALLDPKPATERDRSRAAETALLGAVQRRLGAPGVVRAARGMSAFGEHAVGWLALGLLAAAADRDRRRDWLRAVGGVAAAHAASVGVKRVVRRPRPDDPSVAVLVGTPSRLSFPSAHASSTTAASVLYGALLGRTARRALPTALVPSMLLSRLVLGVHFPSDVLVGAALGAGVAGAAGRLDGGRRRRPVTEAR
jgi:membrane-associated phospholipid phosphatase